MSIIEKINGVFKFIRNMISKIFDFIIKIKDIIWVIIVLIITLSLLSHCESTNRLEKEIDTLTNNTYALSDSIRQYRDELGNTIAEKHALQLTQEEMERTIGELQQKNMEYITYINANINLKDTVYVETVVYKDIIIDTVNGTETGTIHLEKKDIFKLNG